MTKRWKPEDCEGYWFIDGAIGKLTAQRTIWTDHWSDKSRYANGNCFKTKEQAEVALEKIKKVLLEAK